MARHEDYDVEKLKNLLKEINTVYGGVSIENLKKANVEHPEKFPSYKTYERKLGGIKNIKKEFSSY